MKADKTLLAIKEAIEADQGAKFRGLLQKHVSNMTDAFRTGESDYRGHLGASMIGRDCERALWYSFRWYLKARFEARILLLFNRGHLEEARFLAMLELIGCQVWATDGNKQLGFKGYKQLFAGSYDCVVRGIPEMPLNNVLCEFKTHSNDSFRKLEENGVLTAKWEHFVQMQIYMGEAKLSWALYMAVNKNDDSLYAEIVPFDSEIYSKYIKRAISIIDATEPPEKINKSPGWWSCKFCDYNTVCHKNGKRLVTCRSCKHAKVIEGGFACGNTGTLLTVKEQRDACGFYEPL